MRLQLGGTVREIELVVCDCDGVLLASMEAKLEAFRRWVRPEHEQHREAFMKLVRGGFGISRAAHIRRFYREIAEVPADDGLLAREVDRFTAICEPLCADAGWLPGSREFVDRCRAAGLPVYVLSGTPQAPLEAMLAANGGADLFTRIIGSPPDKKASLDAILRETGCPAGRALFIGDAAYDGEAAAHAGVHFAYLPSLADPPSGMPMTTVARLTELLAAG